MDFRLETSAEEPARLDGQRDESIPDGPSTGLAKEHQKGMLAEVMDCLEDLLSRRVCQEKAKCMRRPRGNRGPVEILGKAEKQCRLLLTGRIRLCKEINDMLTIDSLPRLELIQGTIVCINSHVIERHP